MREYAQINLRKNLHGQWLELRVLRAPLISWSSSRAVFFLQCFTMSLKSIFFGIAVTAVLLAMLVGTRMMVLTVPFEEFELREVDTVQLPEPPPPAPEDVVEVDVLPPPPALADLSVIPDVNQPPVPVSSLPMDVKFDVDTFFSDQPPAPLPQPAVKRATVKSTGGGVPEGSFRPQIKRKAVVKSQYSIGELDQNPRLLHHPSVSFPRTIRHARSGRVVVRVAILPSGKSRFLSLVSSTHPDLISPARRIANGSRFTPPTRQGKPVKAVMTWPITIKK
jgi:hypothetical protein